MILDYFPNADHAGIYAAQAAGDYERAGLDVELKPPPDPSAPLKLLRGGRADVVISYEPEVLLARDKGADLVAVGALVQEPLTSLMTLDGSVNSPGGPARQARRHRRHPLPGRLPEDDPRERRRRPRGGQGDQRRLQPRPRDAVAQGRRDARRVLELRGHRPAPPRPQADDHADGEARRPDLQRADLRRPAARTSTRPAPRAPPLPARHGGPRAAARATLSSGVDALLEADPGLERGLQTAVVARRCRSSSPRTRAPFGWQEPIEWAPTATGCSSTSCSRAARRGRGADQRVPAGRGAGGHGDPLSSPPRRREEQVLAGQPLPLPVGLEEPAHLGLVGARRGLPVVSRPTSLRKPRSPAGTRS